MKTVSVTEFKAHCLRLIDEVDRTKEPVAITKRGRRIVVVAPSVETREIDWTPGAFKDRVRIVGDLDDLGIQWEAMRRS